MPACLRMAVQVAHLAGTALIEPFAQAVKAIGRSRRRNADEFKAEGAGTLLDPGFQGQHTIYLSRPTRPEGSRAALLRADY